jgi:hypothetical protein
MYHSFFGASFTHQAAVPVVVKDGCVHYKGDGVQVFVWGVGNTKK